MFTFPSFPLAVREGRAISLNRHVELYSLPDITGLLVPLATPHAYIHSHMTRIPFSVILCFHRTLVRISAKVSERSAAMGITWL